MINNWIKIFLYQLKNNKLFSFLTIFGLSIGIAGLIFSVLYWNDEHSYDDWNSEKEKVHLVINDLGKGTIWSTSPGPLGKHLSSEFPEIESHCYLNFGYFYEVIQFKEKKESFLILDAQKNFFEYFPFTFIQGNAKTCLSVSSMAISDVLAKKLFGDENPLNKTVFYSGRNLVVKGVYELNKKSSLAPEAVTNLIDEKLIPDNNPWGNFNFGLMIKMKENQPIEKVQEKIEKLHYENNLMRWAKDEGLTPEEFLKKYDEEPIKIILEPLKVARLHSLVNTYPEGKGNFQFLLIMMGLSILILSLSIVNYVNLATANAIKRAKEIGVRKVMGASKSNIVYQFIFETVLLTFIAILFALVIVEISLPYYNQFLNKNLVIFGSQFYTYLVMIFVVTVFLAGLFPALFVSNFETLKVLKGNFTRSKNGIWLKNAMLIFQFAIASFFIVGFSIVFQQVEYISSKDLGFKGEQVIQINYRNSYDYKDPGYKEKLFSKFNMIKAELNKIEGVEKVASGSFTFENGSGSSSSFMYKNVSIQGQNMGVDFEMFDLMSIEIKEGRALSAQFSSDTINSMLINETAAKMMKDTALIGQKIDWNEKQLEIVGIVKDFHVYGPQAEIPPMAFFHFKTIDWMLQNVSKIYVKVDANNMSKTMSDIEKFWVKSVNSEEPFSYEFVDKAYARTYKQYVSQRNLFSLLNVIVILIAMFGLFSLASYSIQRRMKEIAIRKTLGAETKTLLKELSKQYIVFCVIGFLLALFPVYFLLSKWLENFAYRIDITMMPFLIGFVVLMLLTLIVVLSKAYQATKVDVLNYLKYE